MDTHLSYGLNGEGWLNCPERVIPYNLEGRLNEFGIKCIPHAVGFIL